MACPCCGPKWVCWQCCCPDGSEPPGSLSIRVEPNSSYRVPYTIFEGTHTLTPVLAPPPVADRGNYGMATCVAYSKQVSGGCDGSGLSLFISFTLYLNGTLATTWWWSGVDNLSRCVTASGTAPAYPVNTPVANICGRAKGKLLTDMQFLIIQSSFPPVVAMAAFDVYVD